MNRRLFLQELGGLIPALYLRRAVSQSSTLFGQAAAATLDRQFDSGNLSWMLLDSSSDILARRWPEMEQPIPPGSLFKPFLALVYDEQHNSMFPRVRCGGTKDHCWLPGGHGILDLEDAIAHSCNAYFLSLAGHLNIERAIMSFRDLGLTGPRRSATPAALIGLTSEWRETPLALAQTYLTLLHSGQPVRNRIACGMQRSAQTGTASAIGRIADSALAKTGTACCTHQLRAAADGFTVVLHPVQQPRMLLLVRMHAATGAQSSMQAAAMLSALGVTRS